MTVHTLVIRDGVPMALPSRDITETFVGEELGLTSLEAERALVERDPTGLPIRNGSAPEPWRGPRSAEAQAHPKKVDGAYTPEGF